MTRELVVFAIPAASERRNRLKLNGRRSETAATVNKTVPPPNFMRLDSVQGDSYNSICVMLESSPAKASGSSSVVECDLAKVDVAGSTPVSRSINFRR